MNERPWHAEADRLRAQGQTIRQIAEQVGMKHSVVGAYFTPALCACGAPRGHRNAHCRVCRNAADGALREAFEAVLIRMWRAGASAPEIAAVTGRPVQSVNSRISVLRAQGVELPYRRPDVVEHARRIGRRARAAA